MDKWVYNFLIELKTLWEKEKLLVTSNFSFSHNVFKSCQLLMCQNEYLWSKGLNMVGKYGLLSSAESLFVANQRVCRPIYSVARPLCQFKFYVLKVLFVYCFVNI